MKRLKDLTEQDVIELRVRVDGWCRKMILGTAILCSLMIIASAIYRLFQ